MKRFALSILLAGSFTSVHALDLHPLQSLTLAVPADGRFDFDSVDIPTGVMLSFAAWNDAAGARPLLNFYVAGDTRIGGGVLATPYDLAFTVGGAFILEPDAFLTLAEGGELYLTSTGIGGIQLNGMVTANGSSLILNGHDLARALPDGNPGGPITLGDPGPLRPVPEPSTWAMLLAGLGVVGYIARRRQRTRIAALR